MKKRLHSLKSIEQSSYEIIFSLLDSIDAINNMNKKLDNEEISEREALAEIFQHLDIVQQELDTLIHFWRLKKK